MKHSAILLSAILLLNFGCSKEINSKDSHDSEVPAGDLVEYSLNAVGESVKATIDMDNGGAFAWSAGDKIAVLNSIDSKYYVFSAEAADGRFKGSAPAGASFTTAYYPASVVLSAEEIAAGVSSAAVADANAVSLPASYSLAEASAGKTFPMRGTVSSENVSFTHLGALIRVSLNEVPAEATTITLSSTKRIAGDFSATLSGSNYSIAAADGASSVSIDMDLSVPGDLEVYFPLPVGSYTLSLTVSAGSYTMLSQPGSTERTFGRANYAKMDMLYVPEPTTEYKLIGRYNISDVLYDWGTESLVTLEPVTDHYGWFRATVNVPDYYIDFKLYQEDGGVYTGNSVSNGRKIVGTMIPVADDGQGDNFTVYTNRPALDVYFSPVERKVFTLPYGDEFVVPTTEAGSAVDEYALIGWHEDDGSWSKDFFLEGAYGFDDWRVVRIGTQIGEPGDEPHFSFKFRRNGAWGEQIGGIYNYRHKANTYCYAKASNNSDLTFYPGAEGQYDIYLKKDLSGLFILPAGTAFNVPGRKEQEDLVSILYVIGGINGTNWSQAYPLEFASADNHEWYALKDAFKIDGWGGMVFKIYNGEWGPGLNLGWPSALEGAIGDMNTVYPLWLRDSDDDIPNIQLGTDGGHVDIYIKADLSEIFTLSHGAPFAVPSESTTPPKAVFIGDSITYFWDNADRGNPSFFSSNNYKSKGVEGQTSATIKGRFNYDVILSAPQQVHILCGVNDLAGNGGTYVAPVAICQNIADMAAAAAAEGIEVFIGSALPSNYLWWNPSVNPADDIIVLNGLLKDLCTSRGYTYVNYYDSLVDTSSKGLLPQYSLDGCHPTKAAYSVMEGIVKPLLGD